MRYYIILWVIICFYLFYSIKYDYRNQKPANLFYYRFDENLSKNKPSIEIIEPFNTLFQIHKIKEASSYKHSNILFFKLLTDYITIFPHIIKIKNPLCIYSLKSIDILANKALLHNILSINYSKQKKYTPVTYILDNEEDFSEFINKFDDSKLYILKKNLQRQKGCTITNNIEYIKRSLKNEYVVGQELLQDPFLVNGHKINLRQYVLVIIKDKCKFKLYNNGFMYYTPKKFKKNSLDKDRHITTGYIDREIYEMNPLTVKEFYTFLGIKKANILKQNLFNLFNYIHSSYKPHIMSYDANHHLNFVILGCDVAVNHNLECKIMEINKGPDLSYKDEKDKAVKYNLVKDTLHQIGLINNPNNNFLDLN
tara:strand:- start:412 stop:1512 length:1101 start_codon:yes stop_codon:yes gene_type:complete